VAPEVRPRLAPAEVTAAERGEAHARRVHGEDGLRGPDGVRPVPDRATAPCREEDAAHEGSRLRSAHAHREGEVDQGASAQRARLPGHAARLRDCRSGAHRGQARAGFLQFPRAPPLRPRGQSSAERLARRRGTLRRAPPRPGAFGFYGYPMW
jgi:hypothetical protein